MSEKPAASTDPVVGLLDVGIELKYLTPTQSEAARKRLLELRQGGINVPIGQILVEQRILHPAQLRSLMFELEYRRLNQPKVVAPAPRPVQTRKFGQYEVIEVLSESGRSRVLKARDSVMDRLVVLKVLPQHLVGDEQWYERFKREMHLAGKLSHPNIVCAYGASEIEGCPSIVLEFVDGLSLADRLEREGNLPEKTAWLVAREVTKALAYAASLNILHRDIKPANIIFGQDGKVKICDLGLSKSMADDMGLTAAGTTVGTPFYIPPEQAHGSKNIDGRADIYSLGCTVFHMLTGSVPFLCGGITDVMVAHTQAPRPDPRDLLPEISEGSSKLVMRMMAIKPDDRPASAQVLVTEIEKLLPLLAEPKALERPVANVDPSEVASKSARATLAGIGKPSVFTRFVDWVMKLWE
ncbi:MAG TPA: serine/threonine-protein kinase [Planctomycetota bacterium]|jgi:serine/threonine protein kinase